MPPYFRRDGKEGYESRTGDSDGVIAGEEFDTLPSSLGSNLSLFLAEDCCIAKVLLGACTVGGEDPGAVTCLMGWESGGVLGILAAGGQDPGPGSYASRVRREGESWTWREGESRVRREGESWVQREGEGES